MSEKGVKYDGDKPKWALLPFIVIEEVVKVLTFGAVKYSPDNWKYVPEYRDRYFSASMRHLVAWKEGEINDTETGLNHLSHAICCLIFLAWFDLTKPKEEQEV